MVGMLMYALYINFILHTNLTTFDCFSFNTSHVMRFFLIVFIVSEEIWTIIYVFSESN